VCVARPCLCGRPTGPTLYTRRPSSVAWNGARKVVLFLIQGANFLRIGLNNSGIRYKKIYAFSRHASVRTIHTLYVYTPPLR